MKKKNPKTCSCGVICDTVALEMEHGLNCKATGAHGTPDYHKHCEQRPEGVFKLMHEAISEKP